MHSEPILHDVNDPLISIVILDYNGNYLRQLLDSIVDQTILNNLEIIYLDNASTDGAWEIALEYVNTYPNIFTVSRNKTSTGSLDNFMNLVKGKYYIPLSTEDAFSPEYLKQCIETMEIDPLVSYTKVLHRINDSSLHQQINVKPFVNPINSPPIYSEPLVSITVHNYNYGRYIRQCLESLLTQTYQNIEICFSDNGSEDESWDIALGFARTYPGKMYVTRNRTNFGSDANYNNCWVNVGGKYLVTMCSDDVLMPDFVEKCVAALEANPNAAYAMVHRAIIDDSGARTDEPPFYNQSCLIPGRGQTAVYMLAAVNPCISQVMYRTRTIYGKSATGGVAARWYGNRILDFNLCCEFDMLYLKQPLMLHRLHSNNDSFRASENLLEIIGPYVLQHQFAETATNFNMPEVANRLPQSLEKLGTLCLRYCLNLLRLNNETTARRYFHLAVAIAPVVASSATFKVLNDYWVANADSQREIINLLSAADNISTRSVSYDPPAGSIPLV